MRVELTAARFPFLARLSASGLRELAACPSARVRPGQRLLQRGDAAGGAYLLMSGSLRVYYITGEGREATLYHVEPGGTCILALTATFNDEPYPAWVQAGSAGGTFVRVPGNVLRRLVDAESAFRDFVFRVLSGRVFELMQALEETGSTQIEERVAQYLLRNVGADGFVRVTQAGIASELGTAREVVYRALRSLTTRGHIRTGRARIELLDPAALEKARKDSE